MSGLAASGLLDDSPPYWAWPWGGGLALACFLAERPEAVRGRRVLDLGAGGGLVAVAAAKAGAARVVAAEIDPLARIALALNAAANGVELEILADDLLEGPPPSGVDVVLVGDLFYAEALAARTAAFLDRCMLDGVDAWVGDVGRPAFPRARADPAAEHAVADVGLREDRRIPGGVFAWRRTG